MSSTKKIERITVKSILAEAWHALTHIEHGLRKTTVALAYEPGKMLHAYLKGDRENYQKPFPLLLISSALFALVLHFFHQYYFVPSATGFNDRLLNNQLLLESKYYSWFHIGLLPVYGLVAFLIFRKLNYNYAEWLVITCYILSFVLLLQVPLHFLTTLLHLDDLSRSLIQLLIAEAYTLFALNGFLRSEMNWVRYILIVLNVVINFFIFMLALRGTAFIMTV